MYEKRRCMCAVRCVLVMREERCVGKERVLAGEKGRQMYMGRTRVRACVEERKIQV